LRDTEGRIIKARLFKSAVIGGARLSSAHNNHTAHSCRQLTDTYDQ